MRMMKVEHYIFKHNLFGSTKLVYSSTDYVRIDLIQSVEEIVRYGCLLTKIVTKNGSYCLTKTPVGDVLDAIGADVI